MQWLIDIIIAAILPHGMIMLWHGSKETVPSGWAVCDGTNGTPDMRDNVVRGASDAYPPGHTAGSTSYDFDFTGDGHSHTVVGGTGLAAGTDYEPLTSISTAVGTTDPESTAMPLHTLHFIMKL